jgi:hypothetical protein
MTVATSTCHICLEELDFDLRYLKKKCCPTEAFICNECWEKIMNTEEIVQCPLCRKMIKSDTVVPVSAITFTRDIESHVVRRRRQSISRKDKLKKYFIYYVLITLLGATGILISVYFLHPATTTFKEEFGYLVVEPFFWIMSTIYGIFFTMLFDLLFRRTLINRMRGGS